MNRIVNIKKLFIMASVIMLFLVGGSAYAETNYSVEMALKSNSTLKVGETVTVNANLKNIIADNGIDVIVAELEYDKNIFENVEMISNNGWNITFASSTNMLTAVKKTKTTQPETVFTIKLKVKANNADMTTISLKNISVSGGIVKFGGTSDISVKNVSLTINKPVEKQQKNKVEEIKYSAEMALTGNTIIKNGEIVTINANLKSINAGKGIDTVVAKLEYDKNVFEKVEIKSNTGWNTSYGSNTNMISAIKNNKVTGPETVFTIVLKAKNTVDANSTTVALKNIVVSGGAVKFGGTGDIQVDSLSILLNKAKTEKNIQKQEIKNIENINTKTIENVETIANIEEIITLSEERIINKVNTINSDNINIVSNNEEAPVVKLLVDNNKNPEQEKQERIIIGTTAVSILSAGSYVLFIKPKFLI